ncbi:MAG: hypothetical protein V1904_02470 [Bacteroidota bacterium]
MRKTIFVLFSIFLCIQGIAETLDSLKAKREMLYQKYSEINIPGKELSDKDLSRVIEILKDLVIVDTRIIKEYGNSDKELKDNAITINELNSENETLNKDKENTTDLLFIIYIAGGVIVAMLVLSLVFLFVYLSKYFKIKKKAAVYTAMLKEADNDRLRMTKMNELIALRENEAEKLKQQIHNLGNEKTVMDGKLKKLEESIAELQKTEPVKSNEYNGQIEKVNINMSKIEKLGRMKELGIVTEEEFNTFKQKFLSEM